MTGTPDVLFVRVREMMADGTRPVRDEIDRRVRDLLAELVPATSSGS